MSLSGIRAYSLNVLASGKLGDAERLRTIACQAITRGAATRLHLTITQHLHEAAILRWERLAWKTITECPDSYSQRVPDLPCGLAGTEWPFVRHYSPLAYGSMASASTSRTGNSGPSTPQCYIWPHRSDLVNITLRADSTARCHRASLAAFRIASDPLRRRPYSCAPQAQIR